MTAVLWYYKKSKKTWRLTSVLQLRACSNVAFYTNKKCSLSFLTPSLSLSLSPSLPRFLSFSHTHTETVKSTGRVRAKDEAWHIKEKSVYFGVPLALRFSFFLYFWFSQPSGYFSDADMNMQVCMSFIWISVVSLQWYYRNRLPIPI